MSKKVVLDAGHGRNTAGKRTPDDEREWSLNNKVVLACIAELANYDVQVLRVDDPTGKSDVSLTKRVDKANAFKADVYVSVHHNANTGKWGNWTGIETYIYTKSSQNALKLAKAVHPKVVNAYGLKDRGIRKANHHVTRETTMPAILVEGGFMDSKIDIVKLRSDAVLKNAGIGIAEGIAEYLGVKKKEQPKPVVKSASTVKPKYLTVKAKSLYVYNTANWNDKGITVSEKEVFTIKRELTVNGSKMYQLKSGLYITANPKYVSVK